MCIYTCQSDNNKQLYARLHVWIETKTENNPPVNVTVNANAILNWIELNRGIKEVYRRRGQ